MKTLFFCLMATFVIFTGCNKDDDSGIINQPPVIPETTLELTIRNSNGNAIEGATVDLFESENDFWNDRNKLVTRITGRTGKVQFTNLMEKRYYCYAEYGCENNINGGFITDIMKPNRINEDNIILSKTGSITVSSQSDYKYRIYINGTFKTDLNGGYYITIPYLPTGNYSIRVLQLEGYLIYPTDKTYTGNVVCGGNLVINFP
jgi:hypothetical protein